MYCVLGCKVILSDYKDSGVIVRPSPLKMPLRYPERHFFKSYPILYPIF